jgi:putative DNA-invertase from lambdoid prophage Rac
MATYGYTRVSTASQADEGQSLDVQERTIRGYTMMRGMVIDALFVERGVSGSVPLHERPEGARLLASLQAGDVIVTPKLDRMFRSSNDALNVLEDLKQRRIALHMLDLGGDVTGLDGNGNAKLIFTILAAVAETERDRIRERIATVKADQRQRGHYLGGRVPFGYAVVEIGGDSVLQPLASEQAMIGTAKQLRAAGVSLRAIQGRLEADHGRRVSLDALQRVLKDDKMFSPVIAKPLASAA